MRSLPFCRVRVQGPVKDAHAITLLDGQLLGQGDILFKLDATDTAWAIVSKSLKANQIEVVKVEAIVNGDCFLQSFGQTLLLFLVSLSVKNLLEFVSNLGKTFRALGQEGDDCFEHVGCCFSRCPKKS